MDEVGSWQAWYLGCRLSTVGAQVLAQTFLLCLHMALLVLIVPLSQPNLLAPLGVPHPPPCPPSCGDGPSTLALVSQAFSMIAHWDLADVFPHCLQKKHISCTALTWHVLFLKWSTLRAPWPRNATIWVHHTDKQYTFNHFCQCTKKCDLNTYAFWIYCFNTLNNQKLISSSKKSVLLSFP